jgi:hypothetical protein
MNTSSKSSIKYKHHIGDIVLYTGVYGPVLAEITGYRDHDRIWQYSIEYTDTNGTKAKTYAGERFLEVMFTR